MYIRDGFPGQRLYVLPAPLVAEAQRRAPTSRLLVTDVGYFPHAARHGRIRRRGAAEAILILCSAGAGWCQLAGVRHEVRAGNVLLIPPDQPHSYYADDADPWSIWWLHVTGTDLPDLISAIGLDLTHPTASVSDPIMVSNLIENVCNHMARDETFASLIGAAGAAWHLLAQLAAERNRRSVGDAAISRVQNRLREHIAEPVSVPQLAASAGFSPSHFSARFRAVTGFSVIEYLKRLRMARARELLLTTAYSISDVAEQVGYTDQFYFSRQFRAVVGASPRQFRQRRAAE